MGVGIRQIYTESEPTRGKSDYGINQFVQGNKRSADLVIIAESADLSTMDCSISCL